LDCVNLANRNGKLLQKVGNHLSIDMASYHNISDLSSTPPWEPQIYQGLNCITLPHFLLLLFY
jgi:hypothetical protein